MYVPTFVLLNLLGLKSCLGRHIEPSIIGSGDPYDVEYILFTNRGNPFNFNIDVNPQNLLDHGFDPQKMTKIIVHGWLIDAQEEYCPPFVDAYITNFDYNVICLDWDKLANIVNYISAAMNTETVGQFVGERLISEIFIESVRKLPTDRAPLLPALDYNPRILLKNFLVYFINCL